MGWICHHCSVNKNKINRLYDRCLRIVYSDSGSSFEDLLDKATSAIHVKNVRSLTIEMFQLSENVSFLIVNKIFD